MVACRFILLVHITRYYSLSTLPAAFVAGCDALTAFCASYDDISSFNVPTFTQYIRYFSICDEKHILMDFMVLDKRTTISCMRLSKYLFHHYHTAFIVKYIDLTGKHTISLAKLQYWSTIPTIFVIMSMKISCCKYPSTESEMLIICIASCTRKWQLPVHRVMKISSKWRYFRFS